MSKPMGMSELMARVGDDNIQFQRLGDGYFQANENQRDCKITFTTSPATALKIERSEVIGFVVWLKKEDTDRALKEHRTELKL